MIDIKDLMDVKLEIEIEHLELDFSTITLSSKQNDFESTCVINDVQLSILLDNLQRILDGIRVYRANKNST